ncbi:microtubule-binding protein [Cystoisospora suis]|uniref:Microtubule-binding protein n=1 Tax=Cystoisospora suis TaxID=483139 RepID=A0A2C6KHB6_9APIC|nr:microtubule-binding protein [Cystoisospora suis]
MFLQLRFRCMLATMRAARPAVRISALGSFSSYQRRWRNARVVVSPTPCWTFLFLVLLCVTFVSCLDSDNSIFSAQSGLNSTAGPVPVGSGVNGPEPYIQSLSAPGLSTAEQIGDHKEVTTAESVSAFAGDAAGREETDVAEGVSKLSLMKTHAANLTDSFMKRISELTGQIDLLRMKVVKAKDEVQRLNETFDDRAQETLNLIEARMAEFSSGLSRLEEELDKQLHPTTGIVRHRLLAFREHLSKLRAAAQESFATEASELMRQVDTCGTSVDELTRFYFDLRSRVDAGISDLESRLVLSRRDLEDVAQEQLVALTLADQRITGEAVQRLQDFLKDLRLEENMLQTIVADIQKQFLESRTFGGGLSRREKGATYIDLSSSFAHSKIEKVCVVITHLVNQVLPNKTVIPIFIHSVAPASTVLNEPPSTRGGLQQALLDAKALFASFRIGRALKDEEPKKKAKDQENVGSAAGEAAGEMVLPSEQILAKAAAQWLQERETFGMRYDHFAMIRIDGLLMEYYTVPFLEYHPYSYANETNIEIVRADGFPKRLQTTVQEKLKPLEVALEKNHFLLIAYVGEVTGDVVQPRASLAQTQARLNLSRELTQVLRGPSVGVYFRFEYYKRQLRFIDQMEKLFHEAAKNKMGARTILQGDDIRIMAVVGSKSTPGGLIQLDLPPCRDGDAFFHHAFVAMKLTLKAVSPDLLAFPSDNLLSKALAGLVWEVSGGSIYRRGSGVNISPKRKAAQTCGVAISTDGVAKRVWRSQVLKASMSFLEKNPAYQDAGETIKKDRAVPLKGVIAVQDSTADAVEAKIPNGYKDVAKLVVRTIARVMRNNLDFVWRGYTVYLCVNVVE